MAVLAEASRPAALIRGPILKPTSTARRGASFEPEALQERAQAGLRTFARPARPRRAMVRFSPTSGATSAIVPMAAIFNSESMEIFLPARRISSQQSLKATPTPASSLNGYVAPRLFRIEHRRGLGQLSERQVVVGDDHVDPALDRAVHRLDAGDAAIDCDHELYVPLGQHPVEHLDLQPVPVDQPVRDDEACIRAEGRSTVCSRTMEVTPSTS